MKKIVISKFQQRKKMIHQKICEEFLKLPKDVSKYQRVMYLADKFNRSDQGIILILKQGGVYEQGRSQKQASC